MTPTHRMLNWSTEHTRAIVTPSVWKLPPPLCTFSAGATILKPAISIGGRADLQVGGWGGCMVGWGAMRVVAVAAWVKGS